MHIGIRAFDEHLRSHSSSRLQIVGDGPQERQWRNYVSRLGLAESVEWTPWLSQNELVSVFDQHDVFLFPSLHDSGGMVVLEALCRGLPVVCLDLGGPGQIVDDTCGRVIRTAGRSRAAIVGEISEVLGALASDPATRRKISAGAIKRATQYTWRNVIDRTYRDIEAGGDMNLVAADN